MSPAFFNKSNDFLGASHVGEKQINKSKCQFCKMSVKCSGHWPVPAYRRALPSVRANSLPIVFHNFQHSYLLLSLFKDLCAFKKNFCALLGL